MKKNEFLEELYARLEGVSPRIAVDSVSYYSEMIDDRIESGMRETEAVAQMGKPEDAARDILMNMPLPRLIGRKCKKKNPWKVWEIIALILGAPLWLSAAVMALALFLSVYAVLWSVVIVVWAIPVSLAGTAVGCAVALAASSVTAEPLAAMMYLGIVLLSLGGTGICTYGCVKMTRLFGKLHVWVTRRIKAVFVKKGDRT